MHLVQTGELKPFSKLPEDLQQKVIDKNRNINVDDYDWFDTTKSDFHTDLETLGFYNIDSQFSGFWSQGDGASFTGSYEYAKGWKLKKGS